MSRHGFTPRRAGAGAAALLLLAALLPAAAGAQVFDFDAAPSHTSLPLDLTVGGTTAHFSATGQGFSVQPANAMGFTPAGFAGLCLYPNSIYAADLLIGFTVPVTQFSILYAPQELGCDASAVMRVTAYMGGVLRGTATATAPQPGTWPTGTLAYGDPAGFDQVVVHYDQRPACTDWGPIFMVDNMAVTPATTSVTGGGSGEPGWVVAPNPFRSATQVRLQLARPTRVTVRVHDAAGRHVRTLVRDATLASGATVLPWDGRDDAGRAVGSGVYFCRVTTATGARAAPLIVRR